MAGLGIEDLPWPPDDYRVDKQTDDPSGEVKFETLPTSVKHDGFRGTACGAATNSDDLSKKQRRAAHRLTDKLEAQAVARELLEFTPASHVCMRNWRIRISGALWALVALLSLKQWVFFTAAVPSWWVKSEQLKDVWAEDILTAFRSDLNRAGAANADGWLYAMIHGEFDGSTDSFQLHIHGIATRGMVDVLRRLRQGKRRKYKRRPDEQHRHPEVYISRKLKIDKPWGFLPAVITYASKSYWPAHNSVLTANGKRKRIGKKHSIPGIHQVRYLLWLDQHRLRDLTLLVHLRVTKRGLTPTR